MLLEDQNKFEENMKAYQDHLKSLLMQEHGNPMNPRKNTFLTEEYKVLSYKEVSNNIVVEKNDDNDIVEVKKLMKFAKNKNNSVNTNIVSEERKNNLLKGKGCNTHIYIYW